MENDQRRNNEIIQSLKLNIKPDNYVLSDIRQKALNSLTG